MSPIQILLTNDDGIESPGLWSAAEALSTLGFVNVVAPRDQFSGAGRSMPIYSDGMIAPQKMTVKGKDWTVFSVGGTPAQAVLHAVLEILPQPPHLVVSGINYGENLGTGITVSGTVGAALEAAALGIPALAISVETDQEYHLTYSKEIDFTASAHFTTFFGRILLSRQMPKDVHVLKVDVPANATLTTPWKVTRLSTLRYYEPLAPQRASWDIPGTVSYQVAKDAKKDAPDTDVYAVRVAKVVSVTPISLDLTSRVELEEFEKELRGQE